MFSQSYSVHPYGSFWLDVVDKVIKGVAVVVGGVWTYVNFRRSRTYRPKIECSVAGEIFERGGFSYTLVQCQLKNAGQSKYTIEQEGTALELLGLSSTGREKLQVVEVFKNHSWIEPGEQLDEPHLLALPEQMTFIALKLDLRVISEGIEWNASCIVKNTSQESLGDKG